MSLAGSGFGSGRLGDLSPTLSFSLSEPLLPALDLDSSEDDSSVDSGLLSYLHKIATNK